MRRALRSWWRAAPVRAPLCLALCLALASGAAPGAKVTERSRQKAAAEAERAGLREKLTLLRQDISRTESAKDDAADTLAESEQAISNANRALRDLAAEQDRTAVRLLQLAAERAALAHTVELEKKQLARLLREQYVAGNEDRVKLLLSGDNPNRINRDLQMLAYVSQARARLLARLRANLRAVELNQAEAQNARDEQEEIAQEEREQKALLEREKGHRAVLLASLSERLAAQRREAGNVARDEQRMSGLVDKLARLIQEQAEAQAEKRRQEQLAAKAAAKARAAALAKQEAERQRLAKQQGKSGRIKPAPEPAAPAEPAPQLALQKAPAKPEPRLEPARPAEVTLAPAVADGAFAALRGSLRAPVAGKLAARFGSKRGDGPGWKGVFVRAAEGADIKAIAAGRVVFAEWLRGFGNLIIVDHGGQYMSIYGNNQSLLKRAGDLVKGGDAIASAGNSGGNEESGLYFELRHQGRAFDPAGWVKF